MYFEPELHRALRIQAAETGRSISDLVNEAVRAALASDLDDLDRSGGRQDEPAYSFELVLRNLRRRGVV